MDIMDKTNIETVCVKNLKVERFEFLEEGKQFHYNFTFNDSIFLLVQGTILLTNAATGDFKIFEAPHIILVESDTDYYLKVVDCNFAQIYSVCALRGENKDIISSDNLVTDNYPLKTHEPFKG